LEGLRIPDASPIVVNSARRSASAAADRLIHGAPDEQRKLLVAMVSRITLNPGAVFIEVRQANLPRLVLGRDMPRVASQDATIRLEVPISLKRRGVEAKLVIADPAQRRHKVDPRLRMLIAKSHLWLNQLITGKAASVRAIAERHGVHE